MNPGGLDLSCPFCQRVESGEGLGPSTEHSVSFPDSFPVSEGHMLVIPRRHVARAEELAEEEWADLFGLVKVVTAEAAAVPGVEGVNVGLNSGEAAGQTVFHAHVHVIPRRSGDVEDPRGGVRGVIPATADYWSEGNGDD